MNTKRYMIIIKGEIKTPEISFCQYSNDNKKWNVKFNNGKVYTYNYLNVRRLEEPEVLNPNLYRISRAGRNFFDIKAIYVFKDGDNSYWHICFGDGSERDYIGEELEIEKSCLIEKQAGNILEYIKQIANLSELKSEQTGEKILPKSFDKINFIGDDIALAKYLNPSLLQTHKKSQEYIPIFPFGCNNSQYKAVKDAMENSFSVIQGPPGTGKTQTILNIIANILMQGKTVQVVSNNNSATENVYEKLSSSKYNLGFVVATLGNSRNKETFIEGQEGVYPDFSLWKIDKNQNISLNQIREKSQQLENVFHKQEELAHLKQEQSQLATELEYFEQYLEEREVSSDSIKIKKRLSSRSWMTLWQECQRMFEKKQKIGLFFKIKNFFQVGITDFGFYKQNIEKIISIFQMMYYKTKEKELSNQILEIEDYLKKNDKDLLNEMCQYSMAILKDHLAKRYSYQKTRIKFDKEDLWKKSDDVLAEYPVILSTTFSSRNSLNLETIYDYLIMDEASQVDVATGALALSCARNVIIVGDTKQLPNVLTEEIKKQANAIFDSFNIHDGYQFTKSFLQSVLDVMPNVKYTLLREHYRCHPKIINFCNQKFYKGQLIIMTEDKGEQDVLGVIKTVQGNHVRNHYSQRQIDVIRDEIIPKLVTHLEDTGIIAPYKNQVKALEKEFNNIDAATVHKFQGREKDTIIISTVDDEISDFADDPYLINVAVSRAKNRLLLVVTGNKQTKERNITDLIDYIQYHNFEVVESKVYSVFDYLYKQYAEERKAYLQKHKKISEYDSENLMYALIEEILAGDKFACLDVLCHFPMYILIRNPELLNEKECGYAMNLATHIDFLLYNRISKKPVLAIEVDGYQYHQENTKQASRDIMKNHILELYGIPLLRFATNGSGEKESIIKKLEEILG